MEFRARLHQHGLYRTERQLAVKAVKAVKAVSAVSAVDKSH
jgi:hypothetical protein